MSAPAYRPPAARRRARARASSRLAYGGNGVARLDGYVVFVAGAVPGDRVRAVVDEEQARLRRGARRRGARARPRPRPAASPTTRARRGRCCPTSASSRSRPTQVDDALRRIGRLDGFELEPIVPARASRGATATSSSTRSARATTAALVCGFHAPGRWDRDRAGGRLPARLRARQRGARAGARLVPRAGPRAPTTAASGSGLLRNLVVREGRRTGQLQVRLVTSPGDARRRQALAAAVRLRRPAAGRRSTASRETTAGGDTELLAGAAQLEEELGGLRFLISPEAFFQTNTEMAERLYGVAGEYAALRRHERVFDLYCGIGTIGLTLAPRAARAVGRRDRRVGGGRRDRQRAAQRDRPRPLLRRRRAPRAARARRAGRAPDVARRSTRRAPASRRRSCAASIEAAPQRIVYVSCNPTTLAPNAAQLVEAGYALRACARSTCSRRRRTSSASRCWSAPDRRPRAPRSSHSSNTKRAAAGRA